MVKGITGWIKTHTPIGRSKSEESGRRESRAKNKLEDTNRKVSFGPTREISVDMARVAEANRPASRGKRSDSTNPPKPSEPPSQPQNPQRRAEREPPPKTVDEETVLRALKDELDRLVPDEDDEEIHLADETKHSIGEQKGTSDEEILASFSLDSIMSDAGWKFEDLPSATPQMKKTATEGDRKATSPGEPKPRELRRKHQHPEQIASSNISPERRGVVTRNPKPKPAGNG